MEERIEEIRKQMRELISDEEWDLLDDELGELLKSKLGDKIVISINPFTINTENILAQIWDDCTLLSTPLEEIIAGAIQQELEFNTEGFNFTYDVD